MSVTAVVIKIPGEAGWVSRKESTASVNGTRTTNNTTPSNIPATISFKNHRKTFKYTFPQTEIGLC